MDPLSLTASVITVIGLAGQVSKGLRHLHNLSKAPQEILALENEVSDFTVVLANLRDISTTFDGVASQDEECANVTPEDRFEVHFSRLKEQIQHAEELLSALRVEIETASSTFKNRKRPPKSRYVSWFQRRGGLLKYQGEIRRAKESVHLTLAVLTASQTSRIYLQLHEVHLQVTGTGNWSNHKSSLAGILGNVRGNDEQLDGLDVVRVEALYMSGNGCNPWCGCVCHITRTLSSPSALQNVIGTLLFGYVGGLLSPSCDEPLCLRRSPAALRITYFFPRWFLARALSYVSFGPAVSIKVLPMRGKDDIIFTYASGGSTGELLKMFDAGVASALDIDPQGWSLLHWAAHFGSFDTCRVLLSLGADAGVENSTLMSPRDLGLRHCLQTAGKLTEQYYESFGFAQSPKLEELGFTRLHKLLLGIIPGSVQSELQFSQAVLNSSDSKGATALLWAVQLKNIDATRQLLDAGAVPNLADNMGSTPLHYAWALPFELYDALLERGADPEARDSYQETPLHHVCRSTPDVRYLRALLSRGVDAGPAELNGWTPLHWAVRYDRSKHVKELISHGADVNAPTFIGCTPLFFAVRYNSHECLKQLLDAGAICGSVSRQGDTVLHYAAAFSDRKSMELLLPSLNHDIDVHTKSHAWQKYEGGATALQLFKYAHQGPCDSLFELFMALVDRARAPMQTSASAHAASREAPRVKYSDLGRDILAEGGIEKSMPGAWAD